MLGGLGIGGPHSCRGCLRLRHEFDELSAKLRVWVVLLEWALHQLLRIGPEIKKSVPRFEDGSLVVI